MSLFTASLPVIIIQGLSKLSGRMKGIHGHPSTTSCKQMLKLSYHIATIAGIPIRLNISLLLLALYLGTRMGSLVLGMLVAALLVASVILHELGHSLVAQRAGIRVREINMLFFGGMAVMDRMPAGARAELRLAAAGPAVSLMVSLAAFGLWLAGEHLTGLIVFRPLLYLSLMNAVLGLFNLVPAFPMDGGRIMRALLTPRMGRLKATFIAARTGKIIAILMFLLGLAHGNLISIAVAVFIFLAGEREYQALRIRHMMFGPDNIENTDHPDSILDDMSQVVVSPPPYDRKRAQRRPMRPDGQD